MKNVEEILNELYSIEPSLRDKEAEVKKIVQTLLESRPEITIDENFINQLREKLLKKRSFSIQDFFSKKINFTLSGSVISVVVVLIFAPLLYYYINYKDNGSIPIENTENNVEIEKKDGGIIKMDSSKKIIAGFVKFKSEDEFNKYLSQSSQGYFEMGIVGTRMETMALEAPSAPKDINVGGATTPDRVSETNVQVLGIDEPDILKTDGKEIYYSSQNRYYPGPIIMEREIIGGKIMPPDYYQAKTQIIKAFPIDKFAKESTIDKTGNLLLSDNTLVVFENQVIYGYDVSNPSSPKEKWSVKLDSRNQIDQARLYDGKIYLVTKNYTSRGGPCPMPLFEKGNEKISVKCIDIYHPIISVPVNNTYHISTINPLNGDIKKEISFVGSYNSTVYMSKNALYVAYSYNGDYLEFFHNFFKENSDIVSQNIIERLGKIKNYDLSQEAKMAEFQVLMQELENSLSDDEKLKFDNEMQNRMESYAKKHKRDLLKTDIAKINISNFKVDALGTIAGNLLNQFSLDEYEGNLRLATTIRVNMWGIDSRESENDIYVMDGDLKITGSIKGLGLDERIYSARFVEDKGYLVTFKQIDPFFVLDLSDPKNPKVKGELKIPGYSSYLHPISKNKILGVGKEGSNVKVSLFDVSDPANPKEASKYNLDDYWSEILNTQHAFLIDKKHNVFFMPGSKGGYVFSYENDNLTLKRAVSNIQAKRALFINDYLYIVGDDKIVVLDEVNWEKVKELDL
ncbi:MAG: beta-propeller domain-containing protein [Patescibacteria group bacterium]